MVTANIYLPLLIYIYIHIYFFFFYILIYLHKIEFIECLCIFIKVLCTSMCNVQGTSICTYPDLDLF